MQKQQTVTGSYPVTVVELFQSPFGKTVEKCWLHIVTSNIVRKFIFKNSTLATVYITAGIMRELDGKYSLFVPVVNIY